MTNAYKTEISLLRKTTRLVHTILAFITRITQKFNNHYDKC